MFHLHLLNYALNTEHNFYYKNEEDKKLLIEEITETISSLFSKFLEQKFRETPQPRHLIFDKEVNYKATDTQIINFKKKLKDKLTYKLSGEDLDFKKVTTTDNTFANYIYDLMQECKIEVYGLTNQEDKPLRKSQEKLRYLYHLVPKNLKIQVTVHDTKRINFISNSEDINGLYFY